MINFSVWFSVGGLVVSVCRYNKVSRNSSVLCFSFTKVLIKCPSLRANSAVKVKSVIPLYQTYSLIKYVLQENIYIYFYSMSVACHFSCPIIGRRGSWSLYCLPLISPNPYALQTSTEARLCQVL